MAGPVPDAVLRLANLVGGGRRSGAGLSPREVSAVRAEVGPDVTLITPGVRPAGSEVNDQGAGRHSRGSPAAGADLLVIAGRSPALSDPGAAAAAIAASLRRAGVRS